VRIASRFEASSSSYRSARCSRSAMDGLRRGGGTLTRRCSVPRDRPSHRRLASVGLGGPRVLVLRADRPMARKRVLVVDDNTENVESLCELVRLWGFEVEAAQEGNQALAAARARRPDAVIMDLGLPDGDALDVIRR